MDKVDICQGAENRPIFFKDDTFWDILSNFEYVCCNIPGPGTDTTIFEEAIHGCSCKETTCGDSPADTCSCIRRSYGIAFNERGQLNVEYFYSKSGAVFECNPLCTCSSKCNNRIVQNGIQYNLEVFKDKKKGLSLLTLDSILSNMFVCEYAGEILTYDEARKRVQGQTVKDMNYIFVLKEHFAKETVSTIVDPKYKGNVGRFLNHSCDPNLRLVPVRVHNMVPRLCLFATRDIKVGEELTYDYSSGESRGHDTEGTVSDRKVCDCGSQNCKRYLPFDYDVLKLSDSDKSG